MPEGKDEFGIPIKKATAPAESVDEFGIPVKKKVAATTSPSASPSITPTTNAPSVSEGGTSGLGITPSVLPAGTNPLAQTTQNPNSFLGAAGQAIQQQRAIKPPVTPKIPATPVTPITTNAQGQPQIDISKPQLVTAKTELGNDVTPTDVTAAGTTLVAPKVGVGIKVSQTEAKKQQDQAVKQKVDFYNNYKQTQGATNPVAADDKENTANFYLEYLKATQPDQYQYEISKAGQLKTPLDKERHTAELMQKAVGLKAEIYGGQFQIAKNNVDNYYKPKIEEYNQTDKNLKDIMVQAQDLDSQLAAFPKDANGQIITDATNRKQAEELIAKHNDIVKQYQSELDKQNTLKEDKDFVDATTQLDDVSKKYQSQYDLLKGISEQNPEMFKALPEYKKLIEGKKTAQGKKNIKEELLGGDLGITEAPARAITNFISHMAFVPKSFTENNEYGWTDKMYDATKNTIDDFNDEYIPLPKGYDKPLLENGQWNLKYLPGKIAGTITDMGLMMLPAMATEGLTAGVLAKMGASGELASGLGTVASGYMTTVADYYEQARQAGMSDKAATSAARSIALQQGLLELASPNSELVKKGIGKATFESYAKRIAEGATTKDALVESVKDISKKLKNEVGQEEMQLIDEEANNYALQEMSGANGQIRQSLGEKAVETALITVLATFGMSAPSSFKSKSRVNQETLYMAAHAPEKMQSAIADMMKNGSLTQEQGNAITQKLELATKGLEQISNTNYDEEKKVKMLPLVMEQIQKQEQLKTTNEALREPIKQEIDVLGRQIAEVAQIAPEAKEQTPLAKEGAATAQEAVPSQEQAAPTPQEKEAIQNQIDDLENEKKHYGLSPEQETKLTELQTQLKPTENAVQEPSTSSVLQHPQENVGTTGSERTGVEPSVQGQETAQKGEVKKEEVKPVDLESLSRTWEENRKEGKYTKDGVEHVRQEPLATPKGKETEVKFADNVKSQPAEYTLVEADELQPSHINGVRNAEHFIPEAQPKERTDVASIKASNDIANNPNFQEVSEGATAYVGTPIINERGEVIQGNNRSDGLKKHYETGSEQYKTDLAANAEKFGLTAEQVNGMNKPVLVRKVKANDATAVQLGNYTDLDVTSGGARRLEPQQLATKLPFEARKTLIGAIGEISTEGTLNKAIRDNFDKIIKMLSPKYISDTQAASLVKDGEPRPEGIKDIEALFKELLFVGGPPGVSGAFDSFSNKISNGIVKSTKAILSTSEDASILKDLQKSMLLMHEYLNSGVDNFNTWLNSADMFNEGKMPKDSFTPTEIALADKLLTAEKEGDIKNFFSKYNELVNGTEGNLLEEGVAAKTKTEAIKELLNVEYTPKAKEVVKEAPKVEEVKKEAPVEKTETQKLAELTPKVGYDLSFDKNNNAVYKSKKTGDILPVTTVKYKELEAERTGREAEKAKIEAQKEADKLAEEEAAKKPAKEKPKQELVDIEEKLDAAKEDDKESVNRLNQDIESLKQIKKEYTEAGTGLQKNRTQKEADEVATKKFKAIVARAFKMKADKKISNATFTEYKNIAKQILGDKLTNNTLKAEEAKAKVIQAIEQVKAALRIEGMEGVNFKGVSESDLLDLVGKYINKSIDLGFTIKEAVDKALTAIKDHPRFKKAVEGGFNEKEFEQNIVDNFAKVEGPVETKKEEKPKEPKKEEPKKPQDREKSILNAVHKAKNISAEQKKRIEEKGLKYTPFTNEESRNLADALIDDSGVDEALNIARSKTLPEAVASMVYARAINHYTELEKNAKTQEEKDTYAQKSADIADEYDIEAREKGRFIQATTDFYNQSPLALFKKEKNKIEKDQEAKKKGKPTKVKDRIAKEFEDIEARVKAGVAEEINKRFFKTVSKEAAAKIDKFFDNLMFNNRGKLFADPTGLGAITASVWNSAVITVKMGVKAGIIAYNGVANSKIINDAIQEGVDYLKKNHNEPFDEEVFKKSVGDEIRNGLKEAGIEIKETKEKKAKLTTEEEIHKKKLAALNKILPKSRKSAAKRLEDHERIVKAYDNGAFDGMNREYTDENGNKTTESFEDLVYEKFGILNTNSPAFKAKLKQLTAAIHAAPPGFLQNQKYTQLLTYVASQKAANYIENGMSIWYAHILSGYETHLRNFKFNIGVGIERPLLLAQKKILQAIKHGNLGEVADFFSISKDALKGYANGFRAGKFVVRTGQSIGKENPFAQAWLETSKNPLVYLQKFPGRILRGTDLMFTTAFEAAKLKEQVLNDIRKAQPGLSNAEVRKAANDMIYGTAAKKAAANTQAEADMDVTFGNGWRQMKDANMFFKMRVAEIVSKDIKEDISKYARDWSERAALTAVPRGIYGAMYNALNTLAGNIPGFSFLVPFTKVPLNIADMLFEKTPLAAWNVIRGAKGTMANRVDLTRDERIELGLKAANYTAAMAAVFGLITAAGGDDDDDAAFVVTGKNTGDFQKDTQLKLDPYSIYVHGHKILEYKDTPYAGIFLPSGYYRDWKKYGKGESTGDAVTAVAANFMFFVSDLSAMKGIGDFLALFKEDKYSNASSLTDKVIKNTVQQAKSIFVPNIVQQANNDFRGLMGMNDYRGKTPLEQFFTNVPYLETKFATQKIDHFGRPIKDEFKIPLVPYEVNYPPDKYYNIMTDKKFYPTYMADKAVYIDGQMKEISKDDLQWLNTKRGQIIKGKLDEEADINGKKATLLDHMANLEDADFKKLMGELFNDAEREAEAIKYIIAPDKGIDENSDKARKIYNDYKKEMDKKIKNKETATKGEGDYKDFKDSIKDAINQ